MDAICLAVRPDKPSAAIRLRPATGRKWWMAGVVSEVRPGDLEENVA
jgi:hypothetical protein